MKVIYLKEHENIQICEPIVAALGFFDGLHWDTWP